MVYRRNLAHVLWQYFYVHAWMVVYFSDMCCSCLYVWF